MAYKYSFCDNETYGASDINEITKRLVTSGVEDVFSDGVSYNLSSVNELGKLLYTKGAVPDGVNTLKVTRAAQANSVLINPGLAFFDDGSVIEILDGGHTLEYTAGEKNFVYLKNNLISENASYPVCSTNAPDGDYVELAEISPNGEITDKRTYAMGKLPGYASNANNVLIIDDCVHIASDRQSITDAAKTYNIGDNNFRFMLFLQEEDSQVLAGVYNIATRKIYGFLGYGYPYKGHYSPGEIWILFDGDRRISAKVSVASGKLSINFTPMIASDLHFSTTEYPYTLYLF